MTTIHQKDITCAICGKTSRYAILGSTNALGGPDLDLRPPEMQRSTMRFWVQQCPECGYCAPQVSHKSQDAVIIMATNEYKHLKTNKQYPELARKFLLYAMLNEKLDKREASAARLRAAWACDDAKLSDLAIECRQKAIADLGKLLPFPDTQEGIVQGAVYIDMLRRVGNFGEAVKMIDKLLAYSHAQGVLVSVLEFHRRLCAEKNTNCYKISDTAAT